MIRSRHLLGGAVNGAEGISNSDLPTVGKKGETLYATAHCFSASPSRCPRCSTSGLRRRRGRERAVVRGEAAVGRCRWGATHKIYQCLNEVIAVPSRNLTTRESTMRRAAGFLFLVLLVHNPAGAAVMTRVFSGDVTVSTLAGVEIGDAFEATLLYDDEAPFNCRESWECFYPAISMSVVFEGGQSFGTDSASMHVLSPSSSGHEFDAGGEALWIRFEDPQGDALSGSSVPTLEELNSPHWNLRRLLFSPPNAVVTGNVFLVTPEPSTALLLAFGLAGLATKRKGTPA